jgi:hypothetical protein
MTWFMISSFLLFNLFLGVSQSEASPRPDRARGPRNLLLVVNQGDQSMSLVDPDAAVQIGKIKTNEIRAHEVTASPDGQLAYLPIYGNSGVGKPGTDGSSVEIVDLEKQAIVGSINVGAVRPHWVRFGPDGMLYVSAEPTMPWMCWTRMREKKWDRFRLSRPSRTWSSYRAMGTALIPPMSTRARFPHSTWRNES